MVADFVSDLIQRLVNEGTIGMAEAARQFGIHRRGKPTHPSTITRWCLDGIRLAAKMDRRCRWAAPQATGWRRRGRERDPGTRDKDRVGRISETLLRCHGGCSLALAEGIRHSAGRHSGKRRPDRRVVREGCGGDEVEEMDRRGTRPEIETLEATGVEAHGPAGGRKSNGHYLGPMMTR